MRKNISSGAQWEDIVGYSRAVMINNQIEIAGTTATINGEIKFPNDAYKQTQCVLSIFKKILTDLGSSLEDVIRTRIYVTNIKDWELIGKAHGEFFKDIKPAATMVEVSALIDPTLVVEIEATAIKSQ